MLQSIDFFESIVNSVTEHIVIIDAAGAIEFVNSAWVDFGIENNSRHHNSDSWLGINYLDVCDVSAARGESNGEAVARGTRGILQNEIDIFYHEYPCHSDTEKRWFMMSITPLRSAGTPRFIISHQNITERKLAEDKVRSLSLLDGLTSIANRRHFDEFLDAEWRRSQRINKPLSLALLDVDHFKLFNDHYGHSAGDDCLKQIATAVSAATNRPGDLSARYGGEEFAVIMGNTESAPAVEIAQHIVHTIRRLAIPHAASPLTNTVTASIGVATLIPDRAGDPIELVKNADLALYSAKEVGRNQVQVYSKN